MPRGRRRLRDEGVFREVVRQGSRTDSHQPRGMRYTQADFEKSRAAVTRALALASKAANRDWVAVAELLLGHLEHISGNEEAALDRYARSLHESRQFENPWRIGNALTGM